jgi:hypothetical protein
MLIFSKISLLSNSVTLWRDKILLFTYIAFFVLNNIVVLLYALVLKLIEFGKECRYIEYYIIYNLYYILNIFITNWYGYVYIGTKRNHDNISNEDNNVSDDSHHTSNINENYNSSDDENDGESTPDVEDLEDARTTLEKVRKAANGLANSRELAEIKEEFGNHFDDEETEEKALANIINLLEEEVTDKLRGISGLLDKLNLESNSNNKRIKTNETEESVKNNLDETSNSSSRESTPKPYSSKESSEELSPLDHVLEKQSADPLDFSDDLD